MSTKKEEKVKKIRLELEEKLNTRLDSVEEFVKKELESISKQSKAISSFVLGQVKNQMDNQLYNMSLTVSAIKQIIVESNLVEDLENKIAEKRKNIHEEQQKAAEEEMKNNMQQSEATNTVEEKPAEQTS